MSLIIYLLLRSKVRGLQLERSGAERKFETSYRAKQKLTFPGMWLRLFPNLLKKTEKSLEGKQEGERDGGKGKPASQREWKTWKVRVNIV